MTPLLSTAPATRTASALREKQAEGLDVIDEVRDELECPICLSEYQGLASSEQAPVSLKCCGRALCRGCLQKHTAEKMSETRNTRKVWISCPMCLTEKAFRRKHPPAPVVMLMRIIRHLNNAKVQPTGLHLE